MMSHAEEALPLRLGGLWLEVCTFGRAHTPLQETHRPPAIPVSEMWQGLLKVRPPCSPYEETLVRLGMKAPEHKRTLVEPRTNLWPILFNNHNLPSGRCQATRQAVAFTAKRALPWRLISSLHIVQATRRDLSVRVVNFYERDQTGICLI